MPGLVTPFFSAERRARLRRRLRPATSTPTAASAGRCSTAASTRPPSQFEAWFVSLAHDEAAIERTCEAAADAFDEAFCGLSELAANALVELADALRGEDSVISPRVGAAGAASRPSGALAAAGPRATRAPGEYALVVESVREGYLLHYAAGRGRRAAPTPTWRCSPATTSTRSASSAWPRSATSRRCASSRT